jgi:hypothetical protein
MHASEGSNLNMWEVTVLGCKCRFSSLGLSKGKVALVLNYHAMKMYDRVEV